MGARNNKNIVKGERLIQIGSSIDENSSRRLGETVQDKGQRLYKTEICRNFEELHLCRYGPKCRYAHGKDELRSVERHPRYKTIFCRTYQATGGCPYGIRCTFLHEVPPTTTLPPSPPPEQPSSRRNTTSPSSNTVPLCSPNPSLIDDSIKTACPSIAEDFIKVARVSIMDNSPSTTELPSPPLLVPVKTPPRLDLPPLSPLPKTLLSAPITCPILCSSFTMNQQDPLTMKQQVPGPAFTVDQPRTHYPAPVFALDQFSYIDHYQLQKQQLVKAAFYSQKNQTPTLAKRRLSGPHFTRNRFNDQEGFHCAVSVWPFTVHYIEHQY